MSKSVFGIFGLQSEESGPSQGVDRMPLDAAATLVLTLVDKWSHYEQVDWIKGPLSWFRSTRVGQPDPFSISMVLQAKRMNGELGKATASWGNSSFMKRPYTLLSVNPSNGFLSDMIYYGKLASAKILGLLKLHCNQSHIRCWAISGRERDSLY